MLLIGAALCVGPLYAAPTLAATTTTATTRDGTKDFNFLIGTWRTHYKRLRHPLRNSHEWYGCDGTSVVRPFWGGSANVEDGGFDKNGVGEFFADDTFGGKPVVVRYRWTLASGGRPHFEQAFSADHGRTWETNWVCDYTRATS
jgi:hypothetical protein